MCFSDRVLQMSFGTPTWLIFKEASPPNTVFASWIVLFPHKCFLRCPPFLLSMLFILSYAWPEAECSLFFSVVVISVDAKNKALKVLCIGLHARSEKFFHQVVGLYYFRNLACQIIVKRLILVGQKKPHARWDYGKVVHYTTLWMTPFNVQDVNVFLAHVCVCFWNLFKIFYVVNINYIIGCLWSRTMKTWYSLPVIFDRAMFLCYYYSFAFLADMLPYPLELF